MIKPQHFAALAIATALSSVMAAGLYASSSQRAPGRVEGALLLPDLPKQINSIGSVEVGQGTKKLTLERAGDKWKLKERDGYPVNVEKARGLIVTLAKMELIDPKTASKDKHALLELEDPSGKDAKSKLVRLRDEKGRPLAEVVLGKSRYDAFGSGRGGTYVRRLGDAQTWLATGEPKVGAEIKDWVPTSIFETDTTKITKITLQPSGEEAVVIEKGDGKDQKFKFEKIPEGQKLKQGVTPDQFAQALGSMDLDDVRKLDASPAGDGVTLVKIESEGGLTINLKLRRDGDASWLSLVASGEGDAKAKADDINGKTGNWEYKIPQWKVDQLAKRRADLFEAAS